MKAPLDSFDSARKQNTAHNPRIWQLACPSVTSSVWQFLTIPFASLTVRESEIPKNVASANQDQWRHCSLSIGAPNTRVYSSIGSDPPSRNRTTGPHWPPRPLHRIIVIRIRPPVRHVLRYWKINQITTRTRRAKLFTNNFVITIISELNGKLAHASRSWPLPGGPSWLRLIN